MTEREINRIRKKFILISTLSLFCVMLLMGGCIYLFNTFTVQNESRQILLYIAENDGELPLGEELIVSSDDSYYEEDITEQDIQGTMEWSLRRIFGTEDFQVQSQDSMYATRYFAVLFDDSMEIEEIKASHISAIDNRQAGFYAQYALGCRNPFGNIGRFYYLVAERTSAPGTIVIYLDRTAQLMAINRIVFIALALLGAGTLLAFFFMRLFSDQIVRNEVENAEKQKQFITNASHELKTPLAVIRANTEMQEMMEGETEWTSSTKRQVDRMNGLIQNLVRISRARETEGDEFTLMNIAPAVGETADSFIPVAESDGKILLKEIPDTIFMKASDSRIRQLVSLLTDNAVKYCDPAGTVRVTLSKSGRTVLFSVSNDYADGASVDYSRFLPAERSPYDLFNKRTGKYEHKNHRKEWLRDRPFHRGKSCAVPGWNNLGFLERRKDYFHLQVPRMNVSNQRCDTSVRDRLRNCALLAQIFPNYKAIQK